MECCITNCKNKAKIFVGNNLMSGEIPLCKKHHKLLEKHWDARERFFKKKGEDNVRKTYHGKKFAVSENSEVKE